MLVIICFFYCCTESVARKYLDMELLSVEILHKRVSMVLSNNHFSFINRPLAPNVIDIAGMHIEQ